MGASAKRILVVDDNPVVRDSVTVAVERLGSDAQPLQLLEAADGATAWDRMTAHKIDLLIVDLYLPVLNGLDLIKKIRASERLASAKILAISASAVDARERALEAGADYFLQKPIRLVDVCDALQHMLRLE